jgi:hypothetical protein
MAVLVCLLVEFSWRSLRLFDPKSTANRDQEVEDSLEGCYLMVWARQSIALY